MVDLKIKLFDGNLAFKKHQNPTNSNKQGNVAALGFTSIVVNKRTNRYQNDLGSSWQQNFLVTKRTDTISLESCIIVFIINKNNFLSSVSVSLQFLNSRTSRHAII